jgi:hypothetical protein
MVAKRGAEHGAIIRMNILESNLAMTIFWQNVMVELWSPGRVFSDPIIGNVEFPQSLLTAFERETQNRILFFHFTDVDRRADDANDASVGIPFSGLAPHQEVDIPTSYRADALLQFKKAGVTA